MKIDIKNEWIKLNRKIVNWEWYQDIATFKLFIHCLIKANWKDAKFKGIEIKRGQFITSLNRLSEETGLSVQQVRTALEKLVSTHSVTKSSFENFTVITVENYDAYQENNKEATHYQHKSNNNRRRIRNKYIYNNKRTHTRNKYSKKNNRKNYCHLNFKFKEESCKDCYKKYKCRKPTSDRFKYLHNNMTFEEWERTVENSYNNSSNENQKFSDDILNNYDWFNEESMVGDV